MRAVLLGIAGVLVAACGGESDSGPYSGLEPSVTIDGHGLSAQVDMVRDGFGVPHIRAQTIEDVAFAQGYVMAADRLPQMDLFRHFATGTIAELFGALDQDQIDTDLEMRIHRMKPIAEEAWAAMQASSDPRDQEIAAFLVRFSDGVNQYLEELQRGEHALDPAVSVWFDAGRAAPWTPVDSLAIGRLQAWSLSYDESDVRDLADWQRATERFDGATDPALQARAGAAFDLLPFKPMDTTSTITDFRQAAARRTTGRRPHVPHELLAATLRTLEPKLLGSLRVRDPRNGSNNWVVGPALTDGRTIMANDPHLQLSSPSIFYLVHLTVPDRLDVQGITFPGIPGVILGHNEHLAWGATTANHDVTDYYLESVAPCAGGGGDCVSFQSGQVPIETWEETIQIGANGTITDSFTVTYERVPHHGPIVPAIAGHRLAPRSGDQALSVRYTGHEVTNEFRAFHGLWTARTVEEAQAAMHDFGFGAQNWVFVDDQGNIGWSTHALVPKRSDGCFTFDVSSNPGGVAPWWVVPGDGSCEWEGYFAAENIPNATNPPTGFLVTANADPIGAIADGDPLNQPRVEDHLLYIGAKQYAEGWRAGRITRRIQAAADASGNRVTAEDMASVQADAHSNYGAAMTPHVIAAVEALEAERAAPGTHADLVDYAAALTPTEVANLSALKGVLAAWSFETPAAVGDATPAEVADSAATSAFNVWAVYFLDAALGDEAGVMGYSAGGWLANTTFALLERPGELRTGLAATTSDPLLCDDLDTAAVTESCRVPILAALLRAHQWLSGSLGFGSADPTAWRWGQLHTLTLAALVPADELSVPPPGDPALPNGYPRHGDNFSVDASSPGFDLEFSYDHGPAMRHVTELVPGARPVTRMALPGGQIYDRGSGHFRDLMDQYWSVNQYFTVPWSTEQIIEAAEARWRFR